MPNYAQRNGRTHCSSRTAFTNFFTRAGISRKAWSSLIYLVYDMLVFLDIWHQMAKIQQSSSRNHALTFQSAIFEACLLSRPFTVCLRRDLGRILVANGAKPAIGRGFFIIFLFFFLSFSFFNFFFFWKEMKSEEGENKPLFQKGIICQKMNSLRT